MLYANAILELFDVHEYEERIPFTAAGFELVAYRMLHYALESYGLRVTNGDRTLAYSADSAPCEGLVDLARDADLFLCEATLASPRPASAATSLPTRRSTHTSRRARTVSSSSTGRTSSRCPTASSVPTTV